MKQVMCKHCDWVGGAFDTDHMNDLSIVKCPRCNMTGFVDTLNTYFLKPATMRGLQWVNFANEVLAHIENYTVPQYGDTPCDQVEEWSTHDCIQAIRKYASRAGKNTRENQDLLDIKKIAHYACLAYDKEIKEKELS